MIPGSESRTFSRRGRKREEVRKIIAITRKDRKRRGKEGDGVHEFRNFADEGEALKMLKGGLSVPGIRESDLEAKAKGGPEKQVLAWWLMKKRIVSRRRISEKLGVSNFSRVTNAVRKVRFGERK